MVLGVPFALSLTHSNGEVRMPMERMLVPVPEAIYAIGLGRSKFYQLIRAGDLTLVHIGRRSFVPADCLRAFVDRISENAKQQEAREFAMTMTREADAATGAQSWQGMVRPGSQAIDIGELDTHASCWASWHTCWRRTGYRTSTCRSSSTRSCAGRRPRHDHATRP